MRAELVRINSHGEAHPIGTVASQRMRARIGSYRVLPAPAHVVFMRYTGDDGQRDDADGAVVRVAGEITAPGALCDVLAMLAQANWRGELVVLDGVTSRSVFFEQGHVVGASTSVPEERLGWVLYRYGVLDEAGLELIAEATQAGRRFGEAAVELGLVSQDHVYRYIGKQIEEIVFSIMTVSDGTFFFLDRFDEARLASRHMANANALLMDGVTRLDEMRYFRERIPTDLHVPVRTEAKTPPSEEFAAVYAAIDGRASIEDIGRITGLGEFLTTKHVYALIQSKHATVQPPRMTGGPVAVVVAANSILRRIFDAAESAGKAESVRENLQSFAIGAGVYDILLRGAGPNERGELVAERVAENVELVAFGADPEHILKQMLYEYVSFALFSAGSVLGADREAQLQKELGATLAQLRPQA